MLTNLDQLKLSHVFDNTTATYKYYWFLSIIDIVAEGKGHGDIAFEDIVIRMLAKAWQPLKCSKLSFGKCDVLINHIDRIIEVSPLNITSLEMRVRYYLMNNKKDNKELQKIVKEMTRYVPYRFLCPWTGSCHNDQKKIEALSQKKETRTPYSINGRTIKISPLWFDFILSNAKVLSDFAFLNLCLFLADRNEGFDMPVERYQSDTADGQHVFSPYTVIDPYCLGFVAEGIYVKNLNVKNLYCHGNMNNSHSKVNIITNIDNSKKNE